jgi:hypothetical protein
MKNVRLNGLKPQPLDSKHFRGSDSGTEGGFMWILGSGSFRVVGYSESQMQALTISVSH